jgi:hypothetical protein
MKYFYDTEFIEDGKTIDLISIGVVAEDGREYYAINKDFNPLKANDWVRANVLAYLPLQGADLSVYPIKTESHIIDLAWKKRGEIRSDLMDFCDSQEYGQPEFWGYYADYDHVVLCQLFGTMMDLPKGWPTLTLDIKQWCDALGNPALPKQEGMAHHALADARWHKQMWEFLADYRHKNGSK